MSSVAVEHFGRIHARGARGLNRTGLEDQLQGFVVARREGRRPWVGPGSRGLVCLQLETTARKRRQYWPRRAFLGAGNDFIADGCSDRSPVETVRETETRTGKKIMVLPA
jgi:hypothetical protein